MGTQIVTRQRTQGHHAPFPPVNQSSEDEPSRRNKINQRAEDGLERVHLVNVAQPHDSERSQHEDSNTGAEVAAVNGDRELE